MASGADRSTTSDSWVDIGSRQSTASLSPAAAAAAADDAVVVIDSPYTSPHRDHPRPAHSHHHHHHHVRRDRVLDGSPLRVSVSSPRPASTRSGDSSQEEYEESESESDRVMTSSNEGIHSSASESGGDGYGRGGQHRGHALVGTDDEGEGEGDDDGDRTTLGVASPVDHSVFTPQPNSFSHPPSSQPRHRSAVPGSYFPAAGPAAVTAATTSPAPTTSARQPHHRHSSSHTPGHAQHAARAPHSPFASLPNHDAALRASLNTLLSCAAAARRKVEPPRAAGTAAAAANVERIDASSLRMVPESVALGLRRPTLQARRISSTPSSSQRAPSPAVEARGVPAALAAAEAADRSKRKAATARGASKERQRLAKKPRRAAGDEAISPTLLTWVVSAGVLVLVSALSFSAGYRVGRDGARFDVGGGADAASLPHAAGRGGLGLRRAAVRAVRV